MRKTYIKTKLSLLASLLSIASYSHASNNNNFNTSTYLGLNAVYSSTKFKKDYGNNIFSNKGAPGLNFFVGHMFNDNWGAEIGYEFYKDMKRTETVAAGNTVAGTFLDPLHVDWFSYKTLVKQRHLYLGGLAKTNFFDDNNFISLMLGVSSSDIKNRYNIFKSEAGPQDDTRTFAATKLIPIARISIERKFNEKFRLQGLVGWKNTSKFKLKSEENSISTPEIRLKDTFSFGLGVSYYLL